MDPPEDVRSVVAYLGPPSSYTHQAALEEFPGDECALEPYVTIQEVFTAVQSSAAAHGVVPFENSTNGCVLQTLDLFADRYLHYPDVYVRGEAYLEVHHYLLGHIPPSSPPRPAFQSLVHTYQHSSQTTNHHDGQNLGNNASTPSSAPPSGGCTPTLHHPSPAKPHTKPLYPLSHITRIYSHPQAFGQCETFLNTYLKGVERQEVSSTSRAAQLVAMDVSERGYFGSAAISSKVAGDVHGLRVLAEGMEDRRDNVTRFFFLERTGFGEDKPAAPVLRSGQLVNGFTKHQPESMAQPQLSNGSNPVERSEEELWKTLTAFTIDHRVAGALADALLLFKTYGLNLTSISSRPSRMAPWHYIFFVEFEGRREEGEGGKVNECLERLKSLTEGCRWHGSWRSRSRVWTEGNGPVRA
ncbi:prephenate dehydratase [Agyrium rufum]|nr:prephenate dehydratase [Agyrium rufum]